VLGETLAALAGGPTGWGFSHAMVGERGVGKTVLLNELLSMRAAPPAASQLW